MDRVWDTSNYHPKPFVTLSQVKVIQGQEVKMSNLKFRAWVLWYMVLGQMFKSTKNDHKILFERPKSDKILKSENCWNHRK